MISPPPPTGRRAGFEENEYLYEHRHACALRGHGRVSGRVPVSLHAAVVFHRTGGARDRQRGRTGQRHRRARGADHRLGQGVSVPVRGRRQGVDSKAALDSASRARELKKEIAYVSSLLSRAGSASGASELDSSVHSAILQLNAAVSAGSASELDDICMDLSSLLFGASTGTVSQSDLDAHRRQGCSPPRWTVMRR